MLTRPEYTSLLTTAERSEAMKLGAMTKLSECGISPAQIDGMGKEALLGSIGDAARGGSQLLVAASLLTGIPIGIIAHKLHRGATKQRGKETELENKIKYYNQAANELETGLAGLGSSPAI